MDHNCMRVLRLLLPAFIGLCLGATMSLMYAPFNEDSCETFLSRQDPQKLVHMRGTKSVESQEEDTFDFEPHLRQPLQQSLNTPGEDSRSAPKVKLVRPRFASTELGIREKLFVGVVTSESTFSTLGVAVNKTLSNYVTKLVYFMDNKGLSVPPGMTVVSFADADRAASIPVHMLKYVAEQFSGNFDYYMFLTDRAYVRGERVFDLVSHISVSRHVHMGLVKSTNDGKPFCHLDGGVIISQSLMERVKANVEWCLDEANHDDPSLNLGRCLLHLTDLACSDHAGAKQFRVYQGESVSFNTINQLTLTPEFTSYLTVFPMPDDASHYKLHRFFCEYELNSTRQEINTLTENIVYMSQFGPGGQSSVSWPVGVPEPYKPKNRFDVIRWDYFTETHIYFPDDFTNIKPLLGADKLDIQEVIQVSAKRLSTKYSNTLQFLSLNNGYRRFDPMRGMEYILDLTFQDSTKNNEEVQKRVQLVRPLGQVEIIPMPYVTESTRIHLVLPVSEEDKEDVALFLKDYAKTCLDTKENTKLLIVFVHPSDSQADEDDSFSEIQSTVASYNKRYSDRGTTIEWTSVESKASFLSEFDLMEAVSGRVPPDSLILLCSAGMELTPELFNRVRMNTIAEWQVFYPIGFWQYRPNLIYDKKPYPSTVELAGNKGHYDMLSYEHASFYISDYVSAQQLMLPADQWNGGLFEMFIKYSKVHVFRAVEPALKHRFKQFDCHAEGPPALYQRCMDRRLQSLATRQQLAKIIFKNQEKLAAGPAAAKFQTV